MEWSSPYVSTLYHTGDTLCSAVITLFVLCCSMKVEWKEQFVQVLME